jgi:hypothetical protein
MAIYQPSDFVAILADSVSGSNQETRTFELHKVRYGGPMQTETWVLPIMSLLNDRMSAEIKRVRREN